MLSAKKNHKDDDEEFTWIQKLIGIDKLVKQVMENYDKLLKQERENYGDLSSRLDILIKDVQDIKGKSVYVF